MSALWSGHSRTCCTDAAALTPAQHSGWRRSRTTRARRRLQDRDARPRDPRRRQPLGDEQSGHVAALGLELYMQMSTRRSRRGGGGATGERSGSRCGSTSTSTRTCRRYIAYEQAKIEVHRRSADARKVADIEMLREELEDRFGPQPEPLSNLILLQRRGSSSGGGRQGVTFRGGRLAATPVELTRSAQAARAQIPEAVYESGKPRCRCASPRVRRKRFPAVLGAADALLQSRATGAGGDRGGVTALLRRPLQRAPLIVRSGDAVPPKRHGVLRLFCGRHRHRGLRQRHARQLGCRVAGNPITTRR